MKILSVIVYKFRDLKFQKKLIWTYIIVGLVPMLIVGTILTRGMKNMAVEQAMKEANVNTDRLQSRINEVLLKLTDVSDRLYSNTELKHILVTRYDSRWDIVREYFDFTAIRDMKRSYPEIKSIEIYSDNYSLIDNWEIRKISPEISSSDWYKKAQKKNGEVIWQYIYNDIAESNTLCLTRLIKDEFNANIGIMVIAIENSYIQRMLRNEPYDTIITVDQGTVIFSKSALLIGKNIKNIGLELENGSAGNKLKELEYNGLPSKVITNAFVPKSSNNVIRIYSVLPIKSIVSKANEISLVGIIVIGISFIISTILLVVFSKLFGDRIKRLRSEMHKVAEGNFEIDVDVKGKDEFGELYQDLFTVIKNIEQLIYEAYEERLLNEQIKNKQKEIEFKMLANQINPHFIYNALESIRMKAHTEGQTEIVMVVRALSRILRRNLEVTNSLVSLDYELDLVKSYLEMQKFRFEDRISYSIDVLIDISDVMVLPLLLQPIVENALVHGLEAKRGQGNINITIKEDGDLLAITVADNGMGMKEEKLREMDEILNEDPDKESTSIGLKNVNSRIKLKYGGMFGLKVTSKYRQGTSVTINLPKGEVLKNVKGTDN